MAKGTEQFYEVFDAAIKEFETFIDDKLTQHKMKPYDTDITIEAPKKMTSDHFEALKKKYLAAGWDEVSWHFSYARPTLTFKVIIIYNF